MKFFFFSYLVVFSIVFSVGCSEKTNDPNDPAASFALARKSYDNQNYEIALQKLGGFKSRFPYSKFAATAELYIANSHFELGQYEEAAFKYGQFIKLHPKHSKVDFALFRIGESFWVDAPEEIDREQQFTRRALQEWDSLIKRFPESQYSTSAKKFIETGKRRLAENMNFVAFFYCKQEIFHACAFRYIKLAQEFPQYPKLRQNAYKQAAIAIDKLAARKEKDPKSDKNIYFRNMSAEQLRAYANSLKKQGSK